MGRLLPLLAVDLRSNIGTSSKPHYNRPMAALSVLEKHGSRVVMLYPTLLKRQPTNTKLGSEGVAILPFPSKAVCNREIPYGHTQREGRGTSLPSPKQYGPPTNPLPMSSTQNIMPRQRDTSRAIPGKRRPIDPAPSQSPLSRFERKKHAHTRTFRKQRVGARILTLECSKLRAETSFITAVNYPLFSSEVKRPGMVFVLLWG